VSFPFQRSLDPFEPDWARGGGAPAPREATSEPSPSSSPSPEDVLLKRLLSELAAGRESVPDLTDAVMGRLGFVRCSAVEARRERRRRSMRRAAVVALALLAACAGYFVAASRETATPRFALAPAVGGAVERQSRYLHDFVNGFSGVSRAGINMPAMMMQSHRFGDMGFSDMDVGTRQIFLVPVPIDEKSGELIELPDPGCPLQRPTPASMPYPQT